mmetsp:Transcript_53761/g.160938  ORF Transcript_53761/g.160938 Transcript_53761/m.160938 type:complete len:242 (-) Transcript_53761:589-1314(-)
MIKVLEKEGVVPSKGSRMNAEVRMMGMRSPLRRESNGDVSVEMIEVLQARWAAHRDAEPIAKVLVEWECIGLETGDRIRGDGVLKEIMIGIVEHGPIGSGIVFSVFNPCSSKAGSEGVPDEADSVRPKESRGLPSGEAIPVHHLLLDLEGRGRASPRDRNSCSSREAWEVFGPICVAVWLVWAAPMEGEELRLLGWIHDTGNGAALADCGKESRELYNVSARNIETRRGIVLPIILDRSEC